MVTVTLNGTVLAQSNDSVKLEGNQYFPPESLNKDALSQSTTTYELFLTSSKSNED